MSTLMTPEEEAMSIERNRDANALDLQRRVIRLEKKLHDLEQLLPHIEGYDYDSETFPPAPEGFLDVPQG